MVPWQNGTLCQLTLMPQQIDIRERLGGRGRPAPDVDNDRELDDSDVKIRSLFSSCYEFDSHDQGCRFDEEKQKADKEKMLTLLKKLNNRLAEINDRSFVAEDELTDFYSAL
ncbi:MAG: hypothetical protein IIZ12_05225 [Eggerthellaceae bacterium]|nr:hypothetical protein [Eggerthellaceae bacterium]